MINFDGADSRQPWAIAQGCLNHDAMPKWVCESSSDIPVGSLGVQRGGNGVRR